MISTDIAWPVVLSCWCSTYQQCGQGLTVSAVEWQQLPTARIWDQYNCFPLPVLACSPCHGIRSLAVHFLVARSKSASPSPVATARQVSSQCHHLRRRRYSRWRACLPALPASLAGELACQRLLSVAAACLPSQPSPPLRLALPQIQTLNLKS